MASPVVKGLKAVLAFAYGLLSLILYILVGIRQGYFFRKTTEKERLELQLGKCNRPGDTLTEACD